MTALSVAVLSLPVALVVFGLEPAIQLTRKRRDSRYEPGLRTGAWQKRARQQRARNW